MKVSVIVAVVLLCVSPAQAQAPTLAAVLSVAEKHASLLWDDVQASPLYKRYVEAQTVVDAMRARIAADQRAAEKAAVPSK